MSAIRGENRNPALPFVVEYRRADSAAPWVPMAAFDVEGPAERYATKCGSENSPWEYRYVDRSAALAHPQQAAPMPVVKALEWHPSHLRENTWLAPNGFGENYVVSRYEGQWRSVDQDQASLEAAKASCQADYEQRILSALAAPEVGTKLPHDFVKTPNDLVMWVCSRCRIATEGKKPGFTKPDQHYSRSCIATPEAGTIERESAPEEALSDAFVAGWNMHSGRTHEVSGKHALEAASKYISSRDLIARTGGESRPINPGIPAKMREAGTSEREPVAWRVVTNNTAMSFYSRREDAEHGAKNRLTYIKGCARAVVEPLYAHPAPAQAPVDGEAVLVPRRPTMAMLKAAAEERVRIRHDHGDEAIGGDYWRVMVAAAVSARKEP